MTTTEFTVGITYCNGISMEHKYKDENALTEAVSDYASMLASAIEPEHPWNLVKHIRLVTMIGYDEEGRLNHHVDSGLFPCKHTPIGE